MSVWRAHEAGSPIVTHTHMAAMPDAPDVGVWNQMAVARFCSELIPSYPALMTNVRDLIFDRPLNGPNARNGPLSRAHSSLACCYRYASSSLRRYGPVRQGQEMHSADFVHQRLTVRCVDLVQRLISRRCGVIGGGKLAAPGLLNMMVQNADCPPIIWIGGQRRSAFIRYGMAFGSYSKSSRNSIPKVRGWLVTTKGWPGVSAAMSR